MLRMDTPDTVSDIVQLTVRVTKCWILLIGECAHNVQLIVTLPKDSQG